MATEKPLTMWGRNADGCWIDVGVATPNYEDDPNGAFDFVRRCRPDCTEFVLLPDGVRPDQRSE